VASPLKLCCCQEPDTNYTADTSPPSTKATIATSSIPNTSTMCQKFNIHTPDKAALVMGLELVGEMKSPEKMPVRRQLLGGGSKVTIHSLNNKTKRYIHLPQCTYGDSVCTALQNYKVVEQIVETIGGGLDVGALLVKCFVQEVPWKNFEGMEGHLFVVLVKESEGVMVWQPSAVFQVLSEGASRATAQLPLGWIVQAAKDHGLWYRHQHWLKVRALLSSAQVGRKLWQLESLHDRRVDEDHVVTVARFSEGDAHIMIVEQQLGFLACPLERMLMTKPQASSMRR
jgi:hypothetical protein